MMIVQYASDLHWEIPANREWFASGGFVPRADVLLLAGDVLNLFALESFEAFWDWCSENFTRTLFVPGNHDYYGTWPSAEALTENFRIAVRDNVFCCNNVIETIGGTDFICSTLWSQIAPDRAGVIESDLLDCKFIKVGERAFCASDLYALHEKDLAFVKKALQSVKSENCVVITHHVPSFSVVASRRKDTPYTSAFVTALDDLICEYAPNVWVFGHSHDSLESTVGKTRLVSNQLGTVRGGKPKDFDTAKTFVCA